MRTTRRRNRARLLVLLIGMMGATARHAHAGPEATPRFARDLPALPPPLPTAPARDADEFARRTWELLPTVHVATALCQGGTNGGPCEALGLGKGVGVTAFFRLTPYVALGAAFDWTSFSADSRLLPAGMAAATAVVTWAGVVARAYFLERGAWDPYLEAGFGRGSLSQHYQGIDGQEASLGGAAAATRAAAGFDCWVLPMLKVGPSLEYRWVFASDLHGCDAAGPCQTVKVGDVGGPTSELGVSLHATFAFGREM